MDDDNLLSLLRPLLFIIDDWNNELANSLSESFAFWLSSK